MAALDSGDGDRFATVSSLYGPGTVSAWYFTSLSVLISWTLHPRKRDSRSIDVDLISTLFLPAVASGDVFLRVRSLASHNAFGPDDTSLRVVQFITATEAPFIITERFTGFSVILFGIAVWTFSARRAALVAVIGVECFAIDYFVHQADIRYRGKRPWAGALVNDDAAFSRLFLADFNVFIVAFITFLGMIAPLRSLAMSMTCIGIETQLPSGRTQRIDFSEAQIKSNQERIRQRTRMSRRHVEIFTCMSAAFLYSVLLTTLFAAVDHNAWQDSDLSNRPASWTLFKGSLQFFPRTACSITDLDQAVAAVAGATVLAFSIYSAGKAYYKIWKASQVSADEELIARSQPQPSRTSSAIGIIVAEYALQ